MGEVKTEPAATIPKSVLDRWSMPEGMSDHTPEPWSTDHETRTHIEAESSTLGWLDRSNSESPANACRIVACVNACAGIPTEELEGGTEGWLRFVLEHWRHQLEATDGQDAAT